MKGSIEKELIDSINRQFTMMYCLITYTFVPINVFIALTYYYKQRCEKKLYQYSIDGPTTDDD